MSAQIDVNPTQSHHFYHRWYDCQYQWKTNGRWPVLVQAVPELTNYAAIEVIEFSKIGSSQMTPTHWLQLSKKINEVLATDSTVTGIVITHGTDTMEETAFFLEFDGKVGKTSCIGRFNAFKQ